MLRRRLLRAVTALTVALGLSGCHEAICGNPVDFDYAFELVGGVYRCKAVPEQPKPHAILDHEPDPALTEQSVTFDGSRSTTPDGTIESYAWDLDADGRFDDGTEPTAEASFERAGEHAVALRVEDSEGRRDRADLAIEILDRAGAVADPIAVLDPDRTFVFSGGTVTFDPSSSSDPDGRIALYSWDLDGDGSYFESSTAPEPRRHRYAEAGTFTARLRVTDDAGLTDVAERTITVSAAGGVQAAFTITPNPVRPDRDVTFDASGSQGDVAQWEWDLDGDGDYEHPSETAITLHNYEGEAQPGDSIDVGLRVSNDANTASSTTTETLTFAESTGSATSAAAAGRRFRARLTGSHLRTPPRRGARIGQAALDQAPRARRGDARQAARARRSGRPAGGLPESRLARQDLDGREEGLAARDGAGLRLRAVGPNPGQRLPAAAPAGPRSAPHGHSGRARRDGRRRDAPRQGELPLALHPPRRRGPAREDPRTQRPGEASLEGLCRAAGAAALEAQDPTA